MAALPSSSSIDVFARQQHQHLLQPSGSVTVPGQRRRGTTKFFNSLKGFGFVVDQHPEELGGQEVFCHFSAISGKGGFRSLAEGEEVEYELVQGPKGFQAANLTGPGGRNVVGDPKARLAKPSPFMPFGTIPMALGGFGSDPYQQQSPGIYTASPYTQHVVYVPTTLHQLPQNQYAYTTLPSQPQGSALLATPAVPNGHFATASSFAGPLPAQQPNYPSFQTMNAPIGNGSSFAGATPASLSAGPVAGRSVSAASFPSFSPPGGFASLSDNRVGSAQGSNTNGATTNNGQMSFAPFNSPPSLSTSTLFGTGQPSSATSSTFATAQQGFNSSSANGHAAYSFGSQGSSNGSALFGGPGAVGSGYPRSGSAGTSGNVERKSTPLGNGTLGGPGVFGPVLYASSTGNNHDF